MDALSTSNKVEFQDRFCWSGAKIHGVFTQLRWFPSGFKTRAGGSIVVPKEEEDAL